MACRARAGVAVIAVVFYFLALSEGPTSIVVPWTVGIVGGAVLGLSFPARTAHLAEGSWILLAAVSIYLIAGHPGAVEALKS